MTTIKHVEIRRFDGKGRLKAFADVVLDCGILIRGFTVMQSALRADEDAMARNGKNGLAVAMPRRLASDGRWMDIVLIENADLRADIEEAILAEYRKAKVTE